MTNARFKNSYFDRSAEDADFELFYDSIFFRRNEAMARRLVELASDGKTRFAVVGAGHMLGSARDSVAPMRSRIRGPTRIGWQSRAK